MKKHISAVLISLMVITGCVIKSPQHLTPIPPTKYFPAPTPKPPPIPPLPTPRPKKTLLTAVKPQLTQTFTNTFVGTTNILTNCIWPTKVSMNWCPSSAATNEWIGYKIYWGSGAIPVGWTPTIYQSTNCPSIVISNGTNWFRTYTNVVDVGTNLTATISNLVTGATYFFSATSYDTNGLESDYSNEVLDILSPTNTLISFSVSIRAIGGGILLQTKLCSCSLVSVWYKNTLTQPWSILASNLTTDLYGNFFYTDATTNSSRFYRLQLQ